mgnify:CR=1 FL=1
MGMGDPYKNMSNPNTPHDLRHCASGHYTAHTKTGSNSIALDRSSFPNSVFGLRFNREAQAHFLMPNRQAAENIAYY